MNINRQIRQNLQENQSHLTVVSYAHNTIESLENQAQDAFSVERTPPEFYMQRMGQLQIYSYGRGRYNLKNYQNQESLAFIAKQKRFETDLEQQESFAIFPIKKKKSGIQKQTFFKIYPTLKKVTVNPEKTENLTFIQNKRPNFEKRSINDILINATGKFFTNKPALKKKRNLEVEYLVIKAPFRPENITEISLESQPKLNGFKEFRTESKFNFSYSVNKPKGYPSDKIHVRTDSNLHLPKKVKTPFKVLEVVDSSKFELLNNKKREPYGQLFIDDIPDLFIRESPAKKYISVGMESMTFEGTNRAIACLEPEWNEEIFIPNIYDMLLIQNFWDSLETMSFRICLRPKVNKNLKKETDIDNKENINENKDSIELLAEKEVKKEEEKKEEKKEGNGIVKRQVSSKGEEENKEGKKKKSRFSLKNSIFGKK